MGTSPKLRKLVETCGENSGPGCSKSAQVNHSQEWSISNFSCSLTRNIASHSMENLAFQSLLRWRMIIILPILTTSLIQLCLKGRENVLFELGNERVDSEVISRFSRSHCGLRNWIDLGVAGVSHPLTHPILTHPTPTSDGKYVVISSTRNRPLSSKFL